jgi:hypothetical protein
VAVVEFLIKKNSLFDQLVPQKELLPQMNFKNFQYKSKGYWGLPHPILPDNLTDKDKNKTNPVS